MEEVAAWKSDPSLDVSKCSDMVLTKFVTSGLGRNGLECFLEWKSANTSEGMCISRLGREDILPVTKHNIGFVCGKTKEGHPIVCAFLGRLIYDLDVEACEKTAVAFFEWLDSNFLDPSWCGDTEKLGNATEKPHQFVTILDFQGFSVTSVNMRLAKVLIPMFQNYYPDRLAGLYLLDPPFLFRGIWQIAKNFIDHNTVQKVRFLTGDWKSELKTMVDEKELLEVWGGNIPMEAAAIQGIPFAHAD